MTFEERIEALLNRAGNTISDIPKEYTDEQKNTAIRNTVQGGMTLTEKICWMTNIIDRLEWALDNSLTREGR